MATTLTSALADYRNAFKVMAATLWVADDVHVTMGHPGPNVDAWQDIVSIAGVRTSQEVATMGTNRSREETLELTVWISVHRPGDAEDLEQECNDRITELLGALEYSVRQSDTTLGGVVRDCFLSQADIDGLLNPALLATGRTVEAECTFTAHVRVTGHRP